MSDHPPSHHEPDPATTPMVSGRDGHRRSPKRIAMWVAGGVLAVVALGFGALLLYTQVLNDPEDELTTDDLVAALEESSTDTAAAATTAPAADTSPGATASTVPSEGAAPATSAPGASDVDGTWVVTEGSELGYRVKEVLFGLEAEGVGRTDQIDGTMDIAGTQVTDASFTVDVATIESDDGRRDNQFRGRIMSVDEFPTATFVLTEPIELGSIPESGEQITATATGDLTLRGVTNSVTFEVTAQRDADGIGVLGNIPVVFADYDIANPSTAGITTEDEGLLEFVLVFARA